MLSNLIEALQIFLKYENPKYPTHCEHDVLTVCISPSKVSDEDKAKLDQLGFYTNESDDCFQSFRYGSA